MTPAESVTANPPADALVALRTLLADDMAEVNRLIIDYMQSPVALIPELAKYIVAAGGNTVLVDTHAQLNARLYRIRYISNQRNDRWHEAVEQHEQIAEALKARDAGRVATLMREHIGHTWVKVTSIDD